MKCGFFDPEKGVMVEVEESEFSRHMGAVVAMSLKKLWASGRHRMPSPYWCMWDSERVSVFPLISGIPEQSVLDGAESASKLHP